MHSRTESVPERPVSTPFFTLRELFQQQQFGVRGYVHDGVFMTVVEPKTPDDDLNQLFSGLIACVDHFQIWMSEFRSHIIDMQHMNYVMGLTEVDLGRWISRCFLVPHSRPTASELYKYLHPRLLHPVCHN